MHRRVAASTAHLSYANFIPRGSPTTSALCSVPILNYPSPYAPLSDSSTPYTIYIYRIHGRRANRVTSKSYFRPARERAGTWRAASGARLRRETAGSARRPFLVPSGKRIVIRPGVNSDGAPVSHPSELSRLGVARRKPRKPSGIGAAKSTTVGLADGVSRRESEKE